MKAFKDADKPISLCPPEKDAKGRFFWRLGERPTDTEFADLNAPNVIPVAFPGWADLMDTWGSKLLDAAQDVAEMAALGFGLPQDTFRSRMQKAPHLLAPTATDFSKFGASSCCQCPMPGASVAATPLDSLRALAPFLLCRH